MHLVAWPSPLEFTANKTRMTRRYGTRVINIMKRAMSFNQRYKRILPIKNRYHAYEHTQNRGLPKM
jgi:hypothetical protein